jgi:hypothetical protein
MQNLLYLQAEITHLEADIRRVAQEDIASGKIPEHAHDWWTLLQVDEYGDARQWQLILEVRDKLEKYSMGLRSSFTLGAMVNVGSLDVAVLKYATMASFPSPTKHELQFLRDWMERPSMSSFPLYGPDRNSWDEEHKQDLMSLVSQSSGDPFSEWFTDKVMPAFHHLIGRRFKKPVPDGIYEYEDSIILTIGSVVSTVVASILPLGSIIILYFIASNGIRLAVIAVLSACFPLSLAVLTKARKFEIFAATSAYVPRTSLPQRSLICG